MTGPNHTIIHLKSPILADKSVGVRLTVQPDPVLFRARLTEASDEECSAAGPESEGGEQESL